MLQTPELTDNTSNIVPRVFPVQYSSARCSAPVLGSWVVSPAVDSVSTMLFSLNSLVTAGAVETYQTDTSPSSLHYRTADAGVFPG